MQGMAIGPAAVGPVLREGRVDEAALKDLGELLYAGGGADVLKRVIDARAGRWLEL